MKNKILFSEKQKFTQWWIWLLLLGVNGIFIYGAYQQVILHNPFGNKPASDSGLIIGFCTTILMIVLFRIFTLETIIKNDGVYVRFFPFRLKFKKYSWNTIHQAYVRQYKPLSEYGGWGIRYGFENGKALNISGNMGLQLKFNNHSKLLIGTNKPHEMKECLNKLNIKNLHLEKDN